MKVNFQNPNVLLGERFIKPHQLNMGDIFRRKDGGRLMIKAGYSDTPCFVYLHTGNSSNLDERSRVIKVGGKFEFSVVHVINGYQHDPMKVKLSDLPDGALFCRTDNSLTPYMKARLWRHEESKTIYINMHTGYCNHFFIHQEVFSVSGAYQINPEDLNHRTVAQYRDKISLSGRGMNRWEKRQSIAESAKLEVLGASIYRDWDK